MIPEVGRFSIAAGMPASRAVAAILNELLDRIVANEAGVLARTDEALHDFRVAVRRTRSARSHFGTVLPSVMRRRGGRFFTDLGRRTNSAHDLEVLLLELPGYAAGAPEAHRRGFASLRRELERLSAREHGGVARWLRSKTYRRAITTWRADIGRLHKLKLAPGATTIESLAVAAIRKAAARGREQAAKLVVAAPDQRDSAIHRLRIRLKKLRYALEFSSALTPGGEAARLIETLKGVQDELGAFQDRVVHRATVAAMAGVSARAPRRRLAAALAAEYLLTRLDQQVVDLRGEILGRAAQLSDTVQPAVYEVLRALGSRHSRAL